MLKNGVRIKYLCPHRYNFALMNLSNKIFVVYSDKALKRVISYYWFRSTSTVILNLGESDLTPLEHVPVQGIIVVQPRDVNNMDSTKFLEDYLDHGYVFYWIYSYSIYEFIRCSISLVTPNKSNHLDRLFDPWD